MATETAQTGDIGQRSYRSNEICHIYELGKLLLENGDFRGGLAIMEGITEVAPDYIPAWLGLCYIHFQNGDIELAGKAAGRALRRDPESLSAQLYYITHLLCIGDFTAAGSYLGEVAEKIDRGEVHSPDIIRFYKMQLARYEHRS